MKTKYKTNHKALLVSILDSIDIHDVAEYLDDRIVGEIEWSDSEVAYWKEARSHDGPELKKNNTEEVNFHKTRVSKLEDAAQYMKKIKVIMKGKYGIDL